MSQSSVRERSGRNRPSAQDGTSSATGRPTTSSSRQGTDRGQSSPRVGTAHPSGRRQTSTRDGASRRGQASSPPMIERRVTLRPRSTNQSLGLYIRGGADSASTPTVTDLDVDGYAANQGLRIGDRILKIDEQRTNTLIHSQVVWMLQGRRTEAPESGSPQTTKSVELVVLRADEGLGEPATLTAPTLPSSSVKEVEVSAETDGWLGCSIRGGADFGTEPVISCVDPNSPASNVNIKKGDRVLRVHGIDVARLAHDRIVHLMTSKPTLRMTIAGASTAASTPPPTTKAVTRQRPRRTSESSVNGTSKTAEIRVPEKEATEQGRSAVEIAPPRPTPLGSRGVGSTVRSKAAASAAAGNAAAAKPTEPMSELQRKFAERNASLASNSGSPSAPNSSSNPSDAPPIDRAGSRSRKSSASETGAARSKVQSGSATPSKTQPTPPTRGEVSTIESAKTDEVAQQKKRQEGRTQPMAATKISSRAAESVAPQNVLPSSPRNGQKTSTRGGNQDSGAPNEAAFKLRPLTVMESPESSESNGDVNSDATSTDAGPSRPSRPNPPKSVSVTPLQTNPDSVSNRLAKFQSSNFDAPIMRSLGAPTADPNAPLLKIAMKLPSARITIGPDNATVGKGGFSGFTVGSGKAAVPKTGAIRRSDTMDVIDAAQESPPAPEETEQNGVAAAGSLGDEENHPNRPTTPMKKILSGTIRKNMDLTNKSIGLKSHADFKNNLVLIEKKMREGRGDASSAVVMETTKRMIAETFPDISAESAEDLRKAFEEARSDEKKLNTFSSAEGSSAAGSVAGDAKRSTTTTKKSTTDSIKMKQVHFAKSRAAGAANAEKSRNGKRGAGRGTRGRRAAAAAAVKDWKPTLSPVCEQKQMAAAKDDAMQQQQQQRLRRSRSVDRAAERRNSSPDRRQRMRAAVLSPTRIGRERARGGGCSGSSVIGGGLNSSIFDNAAEVTNPTSGAVSTSLKEKEKLKQFVARAMQQQTRTAFHKALDTDTSDDEIGEN